MTTAGPLGDWAGRTVVVAASGASAGKVAPLLARIPVEARILAVNLTFRLFPAAHALYAADGGFWQWYADARGFAGLKIAPDARAVAYCKRIQLVDIPYDKHRRRLDAMQFGDPRTIGCGGGNSGFQAVNLAVNAGAVRILLAGFDYAGLHWHADHPPALRNPSESQLRKWRELLDAAAPALAERGVEVLNLSNVSALRAYPYVSPDRVFADSQSAVLPPRSVRSGP